MLVLDHRILCTFDNFINFNIKNKIVKKCAFFIKSYLLQGKNIFLTIAMLKVSQVA